MSTPYAGEPAGAEPVESLEDLAQRSVAGDELAFTEVVERTIDDIRYYVAGRLAGFDAVDEAVQLTYIACWQSMATYQPGQEFLPWLRGIARHRIARVAHKRGNMRERELTAVHDVIGLEPDSQMNAQEMLPILRSCLERLSTKAQGLLNAYYHDQESLAALAERLQRPPGALAVSLHRIRATLRACMEQQGAQS